MSFTKDDESYSMYLSRINIQEVLQHAGYVHNRRDGLRYPSYVKLDSDGRRISGEKFIVNPRFNTCYKPPVIKNYNIISLITENPNMFPEKADNPYRLVHEVCRNILGLPQEERTHNVVDPQKKNKPFSIDEYTIQRFDESHVDGYRGFYPYFHYRGIDFRTQAAFKDYYVLATKTSENGKSFTSLAFPMQIAGGDKTIVGFEERGRPRMDGSSGYKGMARGSNAAEGMWIANLGDRDLSKAKNIYWFESAYDAMAYYQLNRNQREVRKGVFVSTSGNPGINQMQNLLRTAPQATHHLCFDNDLAGKQFVANFEHQAKNIVLSLPKVCSDMKEYMATVKNGAYLKTAEGYASALKAATSIYDDGMRILLNLDKIRQACANNPQGIAATISMNNLYAETVTEFISVFSLLKQAVAKGGKENMLTGAERSKTLWELEDRLHSLSDKLKLLHYSIRHYRMADVWYQATAGMIERDKHEVALQSLSHWKRYAKEVSQYR